MKSNKKLSIVIVYLFLVFSMICWGTSYVFTAIALDCTNPLTLISLRLLISDILLWIVILLFFRKCPIHKKDWLYLFFLALCEPFFYYIGETYALVRISPVVAAPIIATIPIFTMVAMIVFWKQKMSIKNIVGVVLSLVGIVFMIVNKNMEIDVDILGIVLIFFAVFSSVGYGLIVNDLSSRINPIWLIAVQNTIGLFLFCPLWLKFGEMIDYRISSETMFLSAYSPKVIFWGSIVILSVFSSTIAFILYSISVSKIGITKSAVFTNAIPIITALTAFFITGEVMNPIKIFGMLVIICGLILTQIDSERTARTSG